MDMIVSNRVSLFSSISYKRKSHISEMKRDVGMANHENGREQGIAYPIPTSVFMALFIDLLMLELDFAFEINDAV